MRLAYDVAPKIGGTLSRQTFDVDARYYQRLASSGVLALRFRGFKSIGRVPGLHLLRRQLRDARLRLPAVRRPERRVRQRRAALPDHRSGADADRRRSAASAACSSRTSAAAGSTTPEFKFVDRSTPSRYTPVIGYQRDASGQPFIDVDDRPADPDLRAEQIDQRLPAAGRPRARTASASRPSRSASRSTSTGRGARCSTRSGRTSLFASGGGSNEFRKPRFAVWIGYDF